MWPPAEDPVEFHTFPEFRAQPYPYRTSDQDQIVSFRMLRRIPLEGTNTPDDIPSSDTSAGPCPSPPPNPEPTTITTTTEPPPPHKTLCKLLKSAGKSLHKSLRSCKLLRACFPPNPLDDPESEVARMLHAHWGNKSPPPKNWTYGAAERKPTPKEMWLPKARRRFKDDKTGKPIWELEADAVRKELMTA